MYSLKFIYNNKGKDMNDRNSRAATLFKLVNGTFSATEDECKKYADANELLELMAKANKVHDEKCVDAYGITINTRRVFLVYATKLGNDDKVIRESYNTRRNPSIIDALQRIIIIYYKKVK